MKRSAPKRRIVTIAVTSVLVASSVTLGLLVFVSSLAAAAPARTYAVINATVDAATDHEIVTSTAFPNYTTGAVDNYYSLASSHVDNSPFAEGDASPFDTGPIGQTAAAGHTSQPQYADARWPGNGKASFGHRGTPYATSRASSNKATAESSEGAAAASAPAAPKGLDKRLSAAIAAWKKRWLGRLHLKLPGSHSRAPASADVPNPTLTVPPVTVTTPTVTTPPVTTPAATVPAVTVVTTVTTPSPPPVTVPKNPPKPPKPPKASPSGSGAAVESTTLATLDSAGVLVTRGESSLSRVSLGGGQIVIAGIDVLGSIRNTGYPSQEVDVRIGAATIGGVPVTIDQNGVHVRGVGHGLPYGEADSALNTALKKAGVQLFTVSPQAVRSAHEDTITATGVHVIFTQPVNQSGVPSQSIEHIFGEVFMDSLAVPGVPLPSLGLSGGGSPLPAGGGTTSSGGTTGTSVGGTSVGGTSGTTGYPGSGSKSWTTTTPIPGSGTSGTGTSAAPQSAGYVLTSALAGKPLWLLVAYFVWQALVIVTGGSLWYWRAGGAHA